VPEEGPSESEAWETLIGLSRLTEPWAVRVAATLHLADVMSDEGGRVEDIASLAGADRTALERLLRFLVARGVFTQPAPGVFGLNAPARLLRDDHPGRMRRWLDLDGAAGAMDRAYGGLLETVRTGKPAYPAVHGRSFWEDLAAESHLAASFSSLMEAHSLALSDDVVSSYPWTKAGLVVDVGGGTGALLSRLLSAFPHLRGVLFDLVAESPEALAVLEAAGVADRCEVTAGDFFAPLPTGGDIYLLRNIVHDWPDPEAVAILRRCAEAAGKAGRVLVVERVVTNDGDQRELTGMDLRMLTLFGSRERSLEEFNALAGAASMRLEQSRATSSAYWLLEYRVPDAHQMGPLSDTSRQ
jgi:SAM-dependent methyltransferase